MMIISIMIVFINLLTKLLYIGTYKSYVLIQAQPMFVLSLLIHTGNIPFS